jgi:hypothetical protein
VRTYIYRDMLPASPDACVRPTGFLTNPLARSLQNPGTQIAGRFF